MFEFNAVTQITRLGKANLIAPPVSKPFSIDAKAEFIRAIRAIGGKIRPTRGETALENPAEPANLDNQSGLDTASD